MKTNRITNFVFFSSNTAKLPTNIVTLDYIRFIHAFNMCRLYFWLFLDYLRAIFNIFRVFFSKKLNNLSIFCLKRHRNHRKSCSITYFIGILIYLNGSSSMEGYRTYVGAKNIDFLDVWINIFKNGPSKICERQPLKI